MAQGAQKSCGCPICEGDVARLGGALGSLIQVVGNPAQGRGLEVGGLLRSFPTKAIV